MMRILVYGAGAVGCYLGAYLALADHRVTLLGRTPLVQAVEARGLTLQTANGHQHYINAIRAVGSLDAALESSRHYDWIAFTMKAYDTVSAITELAARLPVPPPIVSFQNGVGNEDVLRAAFGPDKVVAATLTAPVSMPAPGLVVEEKRRGIAIAAEGTPAQMIEQAFRQTALPLDVVSDQAALKWSKLLLNITGNATAAILDMHPGEVFRDRVLFSIERAALREALWIMELMGVKPVNLPGAPARKLATLVHGLPNPLLQMLLVQQVSKGRGDKLPSLLAALRAGQRRTEVAWLNGAVVQAADRLGRLAPVNHALALAVSDIAAGRTPWDVYRHQPDMLLSAIRLVQGL